MHCARKRALIVAIWFAVLGVFGLPSLSRAQKYRLGVSTSVMEYASRAFANMLAMDARVWRPGTTDPATLDVNGMPMEDVDIYILDGSFAQQHGSYGFNGTYRLVFNGQADVTAGGGTIQNKSYAAATNTTTADLVVTEAFPTLGLRLLNTRRTADSMVGTGVAGLKLMRPVSIGAATSYDPSVVFTQEFLDLSNRGEIIRSMDFVATNGNIQRNWSDRQLPQNLCYFNGEEGYWWQGKGAPWEHFITLCNQTHKDAWVNIPALASDDYVIQLARLLKSQLDPDRKIYVEYSNEIWNFAFPTWYQVMDEAEAEVRANPNSPLNFDGICFNPDGSFNGGNAVPRYWARRTMQISDIFRAEFGDAVMHTGAHARIFPLFETQAAWQVWIYSGLTFLDRYYNNADGNHVASPRPVPSMIWGGGGSGYMAWFPEDIFNNPNATVDDIFNGYAQSWAQQYAAMVPSTDWCAAFGLKRVAYEGGLAAFDSGPARTASLAAQLDPRMKDAWKRCVDEFYRAGGEIYLHYMGVREDYGLMPFDVVKGTQPTPKLDGFNELDSAGNRPAPTVGAPVPGVINAGRYQVSSDGWSTGTSDNPVNFGSGYSWASYTIRSGLPRSLSIRLTASASSSGEATVFVNGVSAGKLTLVAGVASNALTATIPSGVSGIRIQRTGGTFFLQSIDVQSLPALALSLDPSTTVGGGKSKGTVTLDNLAPAGGTVVSLTAGSNVTVPVSVKVAAGSRTATFNITTASVTKTTNVNITATTESATATATLTIQPVIVAAVTLDPTSALGGTKVSGTVALTTAPPVDVRVNLLSSKGEATVPVAVTVRAGTATAVFSVITKPVAATVKARISATVGASSKGANLIITTPSLSAMTLSPTVVGGGMKSVGTVVLTGIAPEGGAKVTLRSSSAKATVPASIMVPAGKKSVTFDIATAPVAADLTATIQATKGGVTKTATLTIQAPILKGLKLNVSSVKGGSTLEVVGTVTLASPAPGAGTVVSLSSSAAGVASVPITVKVAAGATTATFPVTHQVVATTTTVAIQATLGSLVKAANLRVTK